jgi:hypothetical protein
LEAVGDYREQDIYELPRGAVDLAITQPVSSLLELKLTAKDFGARLHKYETRAGVPCRTIFSGTTYALQVSLAM